MAVELPVQVVILLVGAVATRLLLISLKFGDEYHIDYLWSAFRRIWVLLLSLTLIQAFLGFVLLRYVISRRVLSDPSGQLVVLPLFCGFCGVVFPALLGRIISSFVTVESLKSETVRLLNRLNSIVQRRFGHALQRCIEKDNIDWQRREGKWDFGIESVDVGRKIRVLYELHKEEIATSRRKPALMCKDADVHPAQEFYLLAKYLGRADLNSEIQSPPASPSPNWDGKQNRKRRNGSRGDRAQPDPNPTECRSYDNKELMDSIKRGKRGKAA